MFFIKMPIQTLIVFKKLVVFAIFIAQMTLIMILVKVIMQLHEVIEALWFAEFAQGL